MTPHVVVGGQVRAWYRTLAPEPRRRVKAALSALANGRGDIRPLTDSLAGFHRLRVGQHRIVFRYHEDRVECFYAAPRSTVYEYLAAHLGELLSS